jgi:hypothetical protein
MNSNKLKLMRGNMEKITLNIFTNSTKFSPSTSTILRTYNSFKFAFKVKDVKTIVWIDPNPNLKKSQKYIQNLKKKFETVNICESLSDGYVKAINESNSEYLFMLEHDWKFLHSRINHSLDFIITNFPNNADHFRFNQFYNITNWKIHRGVPGEVITERKEKSELPYCLTNITSGNPHIIHRENYIRKGLPFVEILPGSKGIEENLWGKLNSLVYGDFGYPPTIRHTNGKLGLIFEFYHRLKVRLFF